MRWLHKVLWPDWCKCPCVLCGPGKHAPRVDWGICLLWLLVNQTPLEGTALLRFQAMSLISGLGNQTDTSW